MAAYSNADAQDTIEIVFVNNDTVPYTVKLDPGLVNYHGDAGTVSLHPFADGSIKSISIPAAALANGVAVSSKTPLDIPLGPGTVAENPDRYDYTLVLWDKSSVPVLKDTYDPDLDVIDPNGIIQVSK